ncbi:hypothetical protein IKE84_02065 [Candidatus Saccharibacteria bacterium]|nr:hypothetical protein [Candidatus Saccharibacteria bacterium]
MDPKQTSPLGSTPVGGQEGQTIPPASSVGGNSGATNATSPVGADSGVSVGSGATNTMGAAGTGVATSASPAPVFSTGTSLGSSPSGTGGISSTNIGASTSSGAKMDGMLGAANLSTGANVSRTMSSLNSENQSATGRSLFSRHKFDRAEPDGSIVLTSDPNDADKKATGEPLERRKMIRNIGIIGGILAVVLIVGIVLAFVMAPKKEEKKEIDKGAVAEFIEQNQNNDLYDLEKLFAGMYKGKYAIYQLYGPGVTSLSEKYAPALQSMANVYNELASYNGYIPAELSTRFLEVAELVKNRYDVYTESLELIDDFHTIISGDSEDVKTAALEDIQNYDNIEVQKILNKVQQDMTKVKDAYTKLEQGNCINTNITSQVCTELLNAYNESGEYIDSAALIVDILKVVSEQIDYDSESYILYNLDTLSVDLKNGQVEATEVLNPAQGMVVEVVEETENEQ